MPSRTADAVPMLRTCFSVQGPLDVTVDGVGLELGPVRQQAVFAMLLFNAGRVVTPAALLRGVWGDEAPSSGRKLIPPYIYRLRRILLAAAPGSPSIETHRIGYRLNLRNPSTDADRYEKTLEQAGLAEAAGDLDGAASLLATATASWYGEPLAGLPGPFAEAKRLYLAERRLVGVERRLAVEVRLGRHETAIPALMMLLAEHPLRERVAATLMVALHQAGRQPEALDVFGRVRRSLASQLGLGPTGELTETYEAILHADRR
jgi:SARP family transcriptional regulator, regulator of embCAB operon